MCGIVGYVGSEQVAGILLDGLRRLEYRGYDSAGLAIVSPDGDVKVARAVGKLKNLEKALESAPIAGTTGIGHTRWATHGRPSERNAHPHRAGDVVVIHNGIIENFLELRAELQSGGTTMLSDTDTEVIGHLIEAERRRGKGLVDATRAAIARLRGKIKYRPVVFDLMPPTFTFLQLQRTVEAMGCLSACRRFTWNGHELEATTPSFTKSSTWMNASCQ